jgi:hypothetical protein
MTNNKTYIFVFLCIAFLFSSCKNNPKVISSTPQATNIDNTSTASGIFSEDGETANISNTSQVTSDVHTIKVLEILPTDKYVYLKVIENEEEFWIATGKKEVEIGATYFYKNGILKTNFESKEYNRVFDKVVLVSNIVPANHGGSMNGEITKKTGASNENIQVKPLEVEGSIKISDIIDNPAKYDGKEVQLSGTCTKLNPNIMGRNWIHLKDGSKDDYDLVITSDVAVPEGHVVTMMGTVELDKDFGAGYMYDIIIENGKIVNN